MMPFSAPMQGNERTPESLCTSMEVMEAGGEEACSESPWQCAPGVLPATVARTTMENCATSSGVGPQAAALQVEAISPTEDCSPQPAPLGSAEKRSLSAERVKGTMNGANQAYVEIQELLELVTEQQAKLHLELALARSELEVQPPLDPLPGRIKKEKGQFDLWPKRVQGRAPLRPPDWYSAVAGLSSSGHLSG